MAVVPKIVRARLAAQSDGGMHPDADLLTAFAEQNLSQRERERILTHLSSCAECREVAILAIPQTQSVVLQPSTSTRWFAWPVLRWGALAACGVIVVAAVSLRQRSNDVKHSQLREESASVALQPSAPAPEAKPADANVARIDRDAIHAESGTDVVSQKHDRDKLAVAKGMFAARAKAVPAPAAPPAETDRGMLADAKQSSNKPMDQVASGAALDTAPAAGEAANMTAPAQSLQAEGARASLGKAKDASQLASNELAKSSLAKREAMAAAAPAANQFSYKKLTPRWTLSADGTLQRSLDAGKSWKTIPVSADATFTAVAAMDADIWVGGSHGALYHSVDAGEHWAQVVPSSGGQPLTSNIIGIEFTDSLHGKISTSSQETWTTSDAGQSWQIAR